MDIARNEAETETKQKTGKAINVDKVQDCFK